MISMHISYVEMTSSVNTQILLTINWLYFLLLFSCVWCACVWIYVHELYVHVEAQVDVGNILHYSFILFIETGFLNEIHVLPICLVSLVSLLWESCLALWSLEIAVSHHSSCHFTWVLGIRMPVLHALFTEPPPEHLQDGMLEGYDFTSAFSMTVPTVTWCLESFKKCLLKGGNEVRGWCYIFLGFWLI